MSELRVTNSHERITESPNEESLLSETQHLRQDKPEKAIARLLTTFYTKWVQNWWLFEIFSLCMGIFAIIAICVILIHYQNKPAPELNSIISVGITLNTIIAILSTVGRASLLLPVAECINQQKWAWFSGSAKPLSELEIFDNGSRSMFGSLMLLWRIKVRQFASVGALVLILGLVVDPLSQQLLHYDLQLQPDPTGSAYVSTAITWDTTSQGTNMFNWGVPTNEVDIQDPPLFMKAAVQNGLLTSGSVLNETLPFCATGNCTWPLYRSLAVCMRWQDVTAHLQKSTREENNFTIDRWSLTDRAYIETAEYDICLLNMSSVGKLNPAARRSTTRTALDFSDSIAFSDSPYPLADAFMISSNMSSNGTGNPYNAFEFVLEWCVQEFSTSVVNGTAITTRHGSTNNFTGGDFLTGPIFNSTSSFGFASGGPNYDVANDTHYIISNYLRKTLNGSVYVDGSDNFYKTSDGAEAFFQRFNPNTGGEGLNEVKYQAGLTQVLQNIATSMTNIVRETENTFSVFGTSNRFTMANGTAWREQALVRVQWGWIAAPITIVLLSFIFVTVTIVESSIQTNRYMIWKSSSLSMLLALKEELHQDVGGLRSLAENESTLKSAKASLKRNSYGEWGLQGCSN